MKRILLSFTLMLALIGLYRTGDCQEWKTMMLTADSLCEHAEFDSALTLGETALKMVVDEFGNDDTTTAKVLYKLGTYYAYAGDFPEAEARFSEALSIGERHLNEDHPNVARFLNALGLIYNYQAKYAEAEPICKRSLDIKRRTLGSDHPDVANSLENLALLYGAQDNYVDAESCHLEALRIREKHFGEDHEEAAKSHNALGDIYRLLGRYDDAEKHFLIAKAIMEAVYGADHVEVAYCHTNIANLYSERGLFDKAEPSYRTALTIMEKSLGAEHPHIATALNNLALNCSQMGDYLHAEPLYQRAIEVLEKSLGLDHPDLAHSYNTLANLYQKLGDFDEAKSLYEKALEMRERVLGPDHNDVATSCTDLGLLCLGRMEYPEAEQYFRRALEITEDSRGHDHPNYANCLENLARLFIAQGRFADADSLLSEALRIAEKAYGADHPRVAVMLHYSADSYAKEGRYRESEMLFEKSLDILERTLGLGHPKVARCLESLSTCYRLQEKFTDATSTAGDAFDLRWRNFSENSLVLPEREALAYSMFLRNSADNYLSCYIESDHDKALYARKTGGVVISSKGQVSDVILERRQRLSASTDTSRSTLDESYRNVKYRISKLYVQSTDIDGQSQYRNELDSLLELSHSLETALARYNVDLGQRFGSRRVALDSIAPLIPKRSILVEYLRFNYLRTDSNNTDRHYVAVVAIRDGEPQIIDLGEASEIDALVNTYRSHMLQVSSAGKPPNAIMQEDYTGIGRALYDLIWKPIEGFAAQKELVLIAPDGGLNMISFAGLIDGSGKYLIENYPIHYLSAGRDLVRLRNMSQPGSGLLAVGDPDYNATASARLSSPEMLRSVTQQDANDYITRNVRSGCGDLKNIKVKPLPGTRSEIEQIAAAWKESTDEPILTYFGSMASEEKFKAEAPGNRIIHLATHGYFLQGACQPDIPREGFDLDIGFIGENPLLQSGLFFAGANLHGEGSDSAGTEDGILTAYEVSAMELEGTQLVVLSACETGLGEVREGEGVYGLRRAFQMAGARTVVSALWPVSDRLTAEMMGRLYEKIDESLPRRMREAQLERIDELRDNGQADHPFSWAGFIALGDWR